MPPAHHTEGTVVIHTDRYSPRWRLPCCDSDVVPKVSKLGTKFFAHYARAGCAWSGETEHHLQLKRLVVQAARRHGWAAETEVRGHTPEGEAWTADVLAVRGRARVAVEIQWSTQTDEELRQRQARYENSGVRTLWLIRSACYPVTEEIPAATVREAANGHYSIHLPSAPHANLRRETDWAQRNIPVEAFLEGVFDRRFRWGLRNGDSFSWSVYAATIGCWHCGEATANIMQIIIGLPGASASLSIYDFETEPKLLDELVPEHVRAEHRIGVLRSRFSKTEGKAYLSNGCFSCGALQGRFFEIEYAHEATVRHISHSIVDYRWRRLISPLMPQHWRLLATERPQPASPPTPTERG